MALYFETYRDAHGDGRWRLVGRNGRIVADSSEGYSRLRDAERAVRRIQRVAGALAAAPVTASEISTPRRSISKQTVERTVMLDQLATWER